MPQNITPAGHSRNPDDALNRLRRAFGLALAPDSSGLTMLLHLRRRCLREGGTLVLANAQAQVLTVLDLIGTHDAFRWLVAHTGTSRPCPCRHPGEPAAWAGSPHPTRVRPCWAQVSFRAR
ncbi:STAS domain-containing protein [Streptomyces sp. NPDC057939]|uniref:STAS domain-containing protein n=1 Tax=Streptomyces sp. NPDC057939 TaxID=3346284 RepID=UPI0036E570AE